MRVTQKAWQCMEWLHVDMHHQSCRWDIRFLDSCSMYVAIKQFYQQSMNWCNNYDTITAVIVECAPPHPAAFLHPPHQLEKDTSESSLSPFTHCQHDGMYQNHPHRELHWKFSVETRMWGFKMTSRIGKSRRSYWQPHTQQIAQTSQLRICLISHITALRRVRAPT